MKLGSLEKVKVHEAGHAVVGSLVGFVPISVYIGKRVGTTIATDVSRSKDMRRYAVMAFAGDLSTRLLGMGPSMHFMSATDHAGLQRAGLDAAGNADMYRYTKKRVLENLDRIVDMSRELEFGLNPMSSYVRFLNCFTVKTF